MTKLFKVGDKELTHDELQALVGSGHFSHDKYKEMVAEYNESVAPVAQEEKPTIAKTGKKKVVEDANTTESEL